MVVTGVESSDSEAAATTRGMTAAREAALKPVMRRLAAVAFK